MARTIAPTVDFSAQIDRINQQISEARAEHSRLSLKLAEDPADGAVGAGLDQLEREIEGYQRNITRLQIAAKEAERRDTTEARAERLKLAQAQHKRLVASGVAFSKLGQDIERTLGQLAPLLAQWQTLIEDRASDLYSIMRETAPGKPIGPLLKSARMSDGQVLEALVRLIVSTGLGRTGPDLEPFVLISEPSILSKKVPLVDAITSSNDQLTSHLSDLIDQHAKKLGAGNE